MQTRPGRWSWPNSMQDGGEGKEIWKVLWIWKRYYFTYKAMDCSRSYRFPSDWNAADRDYRISWEFLMIIGILSSMFWLKTLIFALLSGQAISQSTLLKSNNLTEAIQWLVPPPLKLHQLLWAVLIAYLNLRDATSLYIDGQPVFIFSGEFHYWRIPNPSLYLDIFQKIRATGYNAISIYFHWVWIKISLSLERIRINKL